MVPKFIANLGGMARSAVSISRDFVARRRTVAAVPVERESQAPSRRRRFRSIFGRQDTVPSPAAQRRNEDEVRPGINTLYPGDYEGPLTLEYQPRDDAQAEPGEVVWGWVPYEEDHTQGKDRPVLVIGRDGNWLLGLPLSSKNHDHDREQEASVGRYWAQIGSGPWDDGHRSSSVRVNRVVRLDPANIRRIGGQLGHARYKDVAMAVRRHWPANVAVGF